MSPRDDAAAGSNTHKHTQGGRWRLRHAWCIVQIPGAKGLPIRRRGQKRGEERREIERRGERSGERTEEERREEERRSTIAPDPKQSTGKCCPEKGMNYEAAQRGIVLGSLKGEN